MQEHGIFPEVMILLALLPVVLYCLFSRVLARTVVTLPMIFTAAGFALSGGIAHLETAHQLREGAHLLAEVTLVLVLFSDASHIRLSRFRPSAGLPARMLVVGFPLTVVLGTVTVWLLEPGVGWALALLTAAVLSPTDAALGQSVVSNPNVPGHLSQTINVESGLNDGLALPFVVLGALLCSTGLQGLTPAAMLGAAGLQLLIAPLAGGGVAWLSARSLDLAIDRGWIDEPAQGILFLVTAFAAYLVSIAMGGNGFIAAFVGGMVFGNSFRHDIGFVTEFMEGEGQILTMASFMTFGAFLVPDGLANITPSAVLIAISMLTFVRMLPVWLSLAGTGLPARDKLFLGWFGPRGLASLLFTLLVLQEITLEQDVQLLNGVALTVLMSVVLHGITALPLGNRIGAGRGGQP